MGKKNFNKELYANPLPVTLSTTEYGALPTVIPHNPISWIYFVCKYLYIYFQPLPSQKVKVIFDGEIFKVEDELGMKRLWTHGFFGKGSLSRSDPTWKSRVNSKHGLKVNVDTISEDITRKRREERKQFKLLRLEIKELELKIRKGQSEIGDESKLQILKDKLNVSRQHIGKHSTDNLNLQKTRSLDIDLVNLNFEELAELEYLQLQAIEAFFLLYAIDAVEIYNKFDKLLTLDELFIICCDMNPDFVLHYAVYHHYRSLGWCVRSGVKFGCQMLLYNKGPPFDHAEYALQILRSEETMSWTQISTVARVVGGVKKNLVLCYVDIPNDLEDYDLENFDKLFKSCRITEILYRRWIPNRTRD